MSRPILFLIGISLLIGACKEKDPIDLSQTLIFGQYEIFYDQNEDKTHAVAQFRLGNAQGSLMKLDDSAGAEVLFDNEKLPYDLWYGGYHKAFLGQRKTGTFTYKNALGEVAVNSIALEEEIDFHPDFDTIHKGKTEYLRWVGEKLKVGERAELFAGNWTWGEHAHFCAKNDTDSQIKMEPDGKEKLALGKIKVYLDRVLSSAVKEGSSVGGTIRYRYRCNTKLVEVVE